MRLQMDTEFCPERGQQTTVRVLVRSKRRRPVRLRRRHRGELRVDGSRRDQSFRINLPAGEYSRRWRHIKVQRIRIPRAPGPYPVVAEIPRGNLEATTTFYVRRPGSKYCRDDDPPPDDHEDPLNCLEITLGLNDRDYCPGEQVEMRVYLKSAVGKPIEISDQARARLTSPMENWDFQIPAGTYHPGSGRGRQIFYARRPAPRRKRPRGQGDGYTVRTQVLGADRETRDSYAFHVDDDPSCTSVLGGTGGAGKDDPPPPPDEPEPPPAPRKPLRPEATSVDFDKPHTTDPNTGHVVQHKGK